jgi:hypothetical protein
MRPDPISECKAGSGINVDEMLVANGRYTQRTWRLPFGMSALLPTIEFNGY